MYFLCLEHLKEHLEKRILVSDFCTDIPDLSYMKEKICLFLAATQEFQFSILSIYPLDMTNSLGQNTAVTPGLCIACVLLQAK